MLLRALLFFVIAMLIATDARADEIRGVAVGGGQIAHVFDVDMRSAQIEVGLETRGRRFGLLLMPELDLGSTNAGSKNRRLGLTVAGELTIGRLGLGVGLLSVYDWLGPARAIGIGLTALAHVDVVSLENDRALFVMLRADITTMHGVGGGGEDPGVFSGSLGAGIRF